MTHDQAETFKQLLSEHATYLRTSGREGSRLELPDQNFQNMDLSDQSLGSADLSGSDFSGTRMRNIDLFGTWLFNARFIKADLSDANLSKSFVNGADFTETNLENASLQALEIADNVTFDDANLTNAKLDYAPFSQTSMRRAKLCGSSLRQTSFDDVDLVDADFRGAHHADEVALYNLNALVRIDGAIQQLRGEQLRAWLIAEAARPLEEDKPE